MEKNENSIYLFSKSSLIEKIKLQSLDFPLEEEIKQSVGVEFNHLKNYVLPKTDYNDTEFEKLLYLLYEYFSVIDAPIVEEISSCGLKGNTYETTFAMYKSPNRRTSDVTRLSHGLLNISSTRQIYANILYNCQNWKNEDVAFSYFLPLKGENINLDMGYGFLEFEKFQCYLSVIYVEHNVSGGNHLHCEKIPRYYKPNRYFLVNSDRARILK